MKREKKVRKRKGNMDGTLPIILYTNSGSCQSEKDQLMEKAQEML
jgi:hypothetical protein